MTGKNRCASAVLAIVLLLGVPAMGQGGQASVRQSCGPGLNCKVKSLKASSWVETGSSAAVGPVCANSTNARWALSPILSGLQFGWAASGTACTAANTTNLLTFSVNEQIVRQGASGGLATGTGGLSTTGTVSTAAGTAAAPSLTFTGDTNTGLYSVGADQLGVSAAGVRSFNFTSTAGKLEGDESGTAALRLTTASGARLEYGSTLFRVGSGVIIAEPGLQTGATGAGTAFASFPAAAAGNESRILYDTTNDVLRLSTGTTWAKVLTTGAYSSTFSGHLPALAPTSNVVVSEYQPPGAMTVYQVTGRVFVAGTGAGTFGVEVWNNATAASLCAVSGMACTSSAFSGFGMSGCTGAAGAGDYLVLRVDTSGCATAPVVNVTAELSGG